VSLGRIEDFALERYFARWEFSVRHQLSASDLEPYRLSELLELADDDARSRWERLSLGYTESSGLPALRQAIAAGYRSVTPDQVVVCAGAEEGILLAMLASLQSGDEVIVVTPAYQSLHALPRALGATVVDVPLRIEDRWQLDVDAVARARSPRTRMIVVNFPHNPSGAHINAETLRRLCEIATDAGALLFSDEVYRGLEYVTADQLPAATDLSATAASLGVMSKSFALAGLRIGWIASRDAQLLDRIARLKDYTTICSSAPSEVLALIALRARDRVLSRSREIVASNLAHATRFAFAHQRIMEWVPPRAGSVAFPRFIELDASDVSERVAASGSALLMPGRVFSADPRHFRLGLGRRDFPQALSALTEELKTAP
jgi:aspartate/methionine/tyrosine aminotransferase